jgi:hypothetical protein
MTFNTPILLLIFSANFFFAGITITFYDALYSESLEAVEIGLGELDKEKATTIVAAYKGGLMMKRASYLDTPAKRTQSFKAGHQLLESAIEAEPNNAEYRFIRLTIQENAPGILKYNKNIEEDKAIILGGYKGLDAKKRAYILGYTNESTALSTADFE